MAKKIVDIDQIMRDIEESKLKRREIYPTVDQALSAMQIASLRLRDEGWQLPGNNMFPRDRNFQSLILGSTKTFETTAFGHHPNVTFMIADGNDWWPANIILWKPIDQKG